jgi:hypothetical protein
MGKKVRLTESKLLEVINKIVKEQDERNELQQDVSLLADHLKDWTSFVTESDVKEIDSIIRKYLDSNRICVLWDAYKLLDTDGLLDQIDEIGEITSSDTAIELKNSLIESLKDANCQGINLTKYIPLTPDIIIPSGTRILDKFVRYGSEKWESIFGANKEKVNEHEDLPTVRRSEKDMLRRRPYSPKARFKAGL